MTFNQVNCFWEDRLWGSGRRGGHYRVWRVYYCMSGAGKGGGATELAGLVQVEVLLSGKANGCLEIEEDVSVRRGEERMRFERGR